MEEAIVIVEATANGRYYVQESIAHGYFPVVVSARGEFDESYLQLRRQYHQTLRGSGAVFLEEPEYLGVLRDTLAAFEVRAVVAGSEAGTALADQLADLLALPGNEPQTSACRQNKAEMQMALAKAGLRSIRSLRAANSDEALNFAEDLGAFPVVVKPLTGTGAKDVLFCLDEEDLAARCEELLGAKNAYGTPNREILVQEFIRGAEYVVNTVSCGGTHLLTDLWRCKRKPAASADNTRDSIQLVRQLGPGLPAVIQYTYAALSALGFGYGPAHCKILVDENGPVLVDAAARPMDGLFPPELLQEALGHHMVDRALTSYIDPEGFRSLLGRPYQPARSLLAKHFTDPDELRIGDMPAFPLLHCLPTLRHAEVGDKTLAGSTSSRYSGLFSSPDSALLCHKQEDAIMEDYRFLRQMESRGLDHLTAPHTAQNPAEADVAALAKGLQYLLRHQGLLAQETLVLVDDEADPGPINLRGSGIRILPFSQFEEGPKTALLLLHTPKLGTSFQEACTRMHHLIDHVYPGGRLALTPYAMGPLLFGQVGAELLLRSAGLTLEVPPGSYAPGVIWATRKA